MSAAKVPAGHTRGELVRLALECLEEAGITTKALKDIEESLEDDGNFICDVCERRDCIGCDAEAGDQDAEVEEIECEEAV